MQTDLAVRLVFAGVILSVLKSFQSYWFIFLQILVLTKFNLFRHKDRTGAYIANSVIYDIMGLELH